MVLNDPSTVGTSTTSSAIVETFQRKCFYANGRFWVFYITGGNAVYRTSLDGITWTDPTTIGACGDGNRFSVCFDGTYLHYSRFDLTTYSLYYRRGTPNSDGTITWSAVEQTVHAGSSSDFCTNPNIAVDSGGYAWIGVRRYSGVTLTYTPWVLKNANNDGTWADASGFPYQLLTLGSTSWRVTPVALTGLKVYVIYTRTNAYPTGKLYDAGWGSEEFISDTHTIQRGDALSAVNEGDNIHFVMLGYAAYPIRYYKRTYGVGWGSSVIVQLGVTSTSFPVLSISGSILYCFWAGSPTVDHIYYKKCVGGAWDASPTDWIDESTDHLTANNTLSCFYKAYNSYIGLLYMALTTPNYNVRFAYLVPVVAVPPKLVGDGLTWTVS